MRKKKFLLLLIEKWVQEVYVCASEANFAILCLINTFTGITTYSSILPAA